MSVGGGYTNSWSLAGYWQPLKTGWIPSVSTGWGYNSISYNNNVPGRPGNPLPRLDLNSAASQSWYIGLNWKDAFVKGNALGFAFGQPTFVTSISSDLPGSSGSTFDGQYAFELFYKFQVTDNIAVTPALFYLAAPRGELTDSASADAALLRNPGKNGSSFDAFGALIQTTFKF